MLHWIENYKAENGQENLLSKLKCLTPRYRAHREVRLRGVENLATYSTPTITHINLCSAFVQTFVTGKIDRFQWVKPYRWSCVCFISRYCDKNCIFCGKKLPWILLIILFRVRIYRVGRYEMAFKPNLLFLSVFLIVRLFLKIFLTVLRIRIQISSLFSNVVNRIPNMDPDPNSELSLHAIIYVSFFTRSSIHF